MSKMVDAAGWLEREWARILGAEQVRDEDNFFELGGDSVGAIRLLESVEGHTAMTFPVELLLIDGRLGALKEALSARADD